jgi:Flp pilus assembly protein TadG
MRANDLKLFGGRLSLEPLVARWNAIRASVGSKKAPTSAFIRDIRAVTAVEFALVAPFALLLLFGEYTLCDAFSVKRKLTITAHTVADLVARQTKVTTSSLTTIMNASAQVAAPYPIANMTIVVSELTTDGAGNTTVTWSSTLNGTAMTVGANVTLPTGLAQNNTSLIYSNVNYTYTPLLGRTIFGVLHFGSQFYTYPRISSVVTLGS